LAAWGPCHFVDGSAMKEGMLNRVSPGVRAYDPCLSCSTHADGTPALEIALKGRGGELLHTQVLRWPR
jgi:NAD-reducing hydrogenase large subunit